MIFNSRILTLLIILNFISVNITKAETRNYKTSKISAPPPTIDGIIDELAWEAAQWEGNFIQVEPYEKKQPSQQTSFKMVYDENNLYIAIKAFDSSPDSIVRRMSRRDGYEGDYVEVHLDSYHDNLTAFSFTINVAGVKSDAVTSKGNWDSSWDPIWYAKTSINQEGWIAEIRIPLTQLRFGKQEEYIWGLQLTRHLFRKGEKSCWQFISPTASSWVDNFGELFGIKNISPKKQKDLTPYVVGSFESFKKEPENPYAAKGNDLKGTVGLDGKLGITNDFTLDFSINPDFGQVEADPSEVNLTTFETYFPEKRAFFIEGKNILSHNIVGGDGPLSRDNLFYSRRIGKQPTQYPDVDSDNGEYTDVPDNTTILGAFKITGKTKKGWSVGLLESFTEKEVADISINDSTYTEIAEPFTNYLAGRVEKDLNNSNTRVGVAFTSVNRSLPTTELKENMNSDAYTGGFNFTHNWKNKTYYLNVNSVFSYIKGSALSITQMQTSAPHFFQRPDASHIKVDSSQKQMNGYGGTVQIGKAGNGRWSFTHWITWRSPGLNLNDIGYLRRNDEIQEIFWMGYYQNEPVWIFRNYNLNFNQWYGTTFGLESKYFGGNINGHVTYTNYWCTGFGISRDGKSILTEVLRGGPSLRYEGFTEYWGHVGTDYRKKLKLVLMYSGGMRDNNTRMFQKYSVSINYQVSDAFRVSLEPRYSINKSKAHYITTIEDVEPCRYILANLDQNETSLTLQLTYNITPDFTIQYYGMPFISNGRYDNFKYLNDPHADDINVRYLTYTENQIDYNDQAEIYFVDENNDNITDYSFDKPDFRRLDFNSNLVIRWEYSPGSTIYGVWSQQRNYSSNDGTFSFTEESKYLFADTYPHDVFLIKFSYRFGL